jgi:hypothetical protein
VLDPAKFPYNPDVAYHPAGQEMGKAEYFLQLMACYECHCRMNTPRIGRLKFPQFEG